MVPKVCEFRLILFDAPGEQWLAKCDRWRRKPRLGRGRVRPERPVVNQNGAIEPLFATSPSPSKPPDGLAWRGHGALGPTFAVVSGRRMTGAVENSSAPTSFVPDRVCPSRSMVTSGNEPTAVLIAGLVDSSLNILKESCESIGLTRRAPLVGISPLVAAPKTIFPAKLAFGAGPLRSRITPESV